MGSTIEFVGIPRSHCQKIWNRVQPMSFLQRRRWNAESQCHHSLLFISRSRPPHRRLFTWTEALDTGKTLPTVQYAILLRTAWLHFVHSILKVVCFPSLQYLRSDEQNVIICALGMSTIFTRQCSTMTRASVHFSKLSYVELISLYLILAIHLVLCAAATN